MLPSMSRDTLAAWAVMLGLYLELTVAREREVGKPRTRLCISIVLCARAVSVLRFCKHCPFTGTRPGGLMSGRARSRAARPSGRRR